MNLELCCCMGGFAEGFRRAGIDFDLAFDFDPNACESYRRNLGHAPVRVDVRDLLRLARAGLLHAGEDGVDFLLADPPCTPWSRAGKRKGLDDERDLLGVTVELIRLLRPTCFLIGNVPGLDDATNAGALTRTLGTLGRFGYCTGDYVRLDAADFGTPQHRVRPFWFGHPKGTPCITWPARTHASPEELEGPFLPGADVLLPWVTVREALTRSGLSRDRWGRRVRLRDVRDWPSDHRPSEEDSPTGCLTRNTHCDGAIVAVREHHAVPFEDAPARVLTTKQDDARVIRVGDAQGQRVHDADEPGRVVTTSTGIHGIVRVCERHPPIDPDGPASTRTAKKRGPGGQLFDWPWDRPSTSVMADPRVAEPGHRDEHWTLRRPATTLMTGNATGLMAQPGHGSVWQRQRGPDAIVLSEEAALVIQGFPITWQVAGRTKRERWGQIGQAMPPQLAEAVGRSVRAWMEASRARRRTAR